MLFEVQDVLARPDCYAHVVLLVGTLSPEDVVDYVLLFVGGVDANIDAPARQTLIYGVSVIQQLLIVDNLPALHVKSLWYELKPYYYSQKMV